MLEEEFVTSMGSLLVVDKICIMQASVFLSTTNLRFRFFLFFPDNLPIVQ